ncbi:sugar ABC transporter ATP-binding protein, partial [Fimbriimonadia bacterium ATM]|nr:sugar ABC transporter ATP-binding protein [Fimbriimonadia bacterium ATM]
MSAFTLASRDLSMQFPAVLALDSVSVSFKSGEVHGVVGENGAGKSTLMRILSGIQTPTSGEVFISGQPVRLHGVRDAIGRGIAMIHQELDVVDELTVAENIFLGEEITKRGILCSTKMKEETRALLSQLGAKFSADTRVESLSVAGKQLVAVAKALSLNAKVLIMDEPTAVLSEHEADALFSVIEKLKSQGVAIVYISHRLSEVLQICDRITVL